MSITATVEGGTIRLSPDVHWPSGTVVSVEPVSLEEAFVLREMALLRSTARDLPDDLAINHDYYLHGGHKQQSRIARWVPSSKPTPELDEEEAREFTNKLLEFAAQTKILPPDFSANHDHYLHGPPK